MTSLLHLSDLHVGTERVELMSALQRFCARERPALIVASGDITQRARRRQFDEAFAFLRSLGGVALLAVPGNHDVPLFDLLSRIATPYAGWRRVFGPVLEPRIVGDDFAVAGLNSTRRWRHIQGEVSASQVHDVGAWLLQQTGRAVRVLVVHHPVAATLESDRANLLRGAEPALRAWAAAGADVVLSGHIHLPFVVPLHERLPELKRRLWAVNAGTAVSRRVRAGAPPSFNLLRAPSRPGHTLVVERWDFDAGGGDFAGAQVHELALDRR